MSSVDPLVDESSQGSVSSSYSTLHTDRNLTSEGLVTRWRVSPSGDQLSRTRHMMKRRDHRNAQALSLGPLTDRFSEGNDHH
jgi:hypothetical protein